MAKHPEAIVNKAEGAKAVFNTSESEQVSGSGQVSASEQTSGSGHEQTSGSGQVSDSEQGVRSRKAFMVNQFAPSIDWINKTVVSGGKGTRMILGRLCGFVYKTTSKQQQMRDASFITTIALHGVFKSEDYQTGEISECGVAYLPSGVPIQEKIAAIFENSRPIKEDGTKGDPAVKMVEIDLDIGLEATGKALPYTWIVIQHIEGEAFEPMRRLWNSRKRPEKAKLLSGAQSLLTGPQEGTK